LKCSENNARKCAVEVLVEVLRTLITAVGGLDL